MKQRDLAIIIVIGFIAAMASWGISRIIFGNQTERALKAPTVEPITADFKLPESKYFNSQSIDLTKVIKIGDTTNSDPIKSTNP